MGTSQLASPYSLLPKRRGSRGRLRSCKGGPMFFSTGRATPSPIPEQMLIPVLRLSQIPATNRSISELLSGLNCEGFYDRYVLQQFLGKAVAALQVFRAVVRNPDFSLAVFPDQNL